MPQFMNKYGVWIIVACLALCIPLAWSSLRRTPPVSGYPGDSSLAFYVDEETGEESSGPADAVFPLVGKNGKPTVVQAVKIDFVGEGTGVKTVYLLKYAPGVEEELSSLEPDNPRRVNVMNDGRMVRLPAPGSPWVMENSPEGQAIENNINPGTGEARPVYPKR